jgi:hypothetical protein
MNPHKRVRRVVGGLCGANCLILETPITPHCLEVHTVGHTVDCIENGVDFVEKLDPSLHVV